MQEAKEKNKIENPKLYDFVYNEPITIQPHLNFAQIPSFIENVQYQTLQKVKHNFEQDKKQLQHITWSQVPIPQPQMNVKIVGGNRNQERKARNKEAKRFMKMESLCKDENCKDENCERESTESEESGNIVKTQESAKLITASKIKNICTHCSKESEFMICNECTRNGRGIKLNIDKSELLGDVYIGAGAPEKEPVLTEFAKAAIKLKNIPNVQKWFSSEIFARLGGNDVRHRTTSPSADKLVYAANTSGGS